MNLGALCRTAEVFRLKQLVVASLSILDDRNFRKLAVSADSWQPITACPAHRLYEWVSQQQEGGVTVLALTRHPGAISLPNFCFPARAALLLGRELTGIPPDLMNHCDTIVEIPQFGCVESLNVQTAAAIAAYAYLTQQTSAVSKRKLD